MWPVVDFVELTATFFACVAERALDRDGLGDVAERRRRAVRVDVADRRPAFSPASRMRVEHALIGALPVLGGAVMW